MEKTKTEKLKEYLLDNIETLKDIVREINSWDGSLDYLEYYDNDEEFFELFYQDRTLEAVRAVCYGNYNYNDDLVRIDVYGNLESTSDYMYKEELKNYIDEIVERLEEEQENLTIYDDELKEILEKE